MTDVSKDAHTILYHEFRIFQDFYTLHIRLVVLNFEVKACSGMSCLSNSQYALQSTVYLRIPCLFARSVYDLSSRRKDKPSHSQGAILITIKRTIMKFARRHSNHLH